MTQLKILCDTFLKQQPVDSSQLTSLEKQFVGVNTCFDLISYADAANHHIKIAFANQLSPGQNIWYVYRPHVQLLNDRGQLILPNSVQLKVPYLSQLDNIKNPYGSCNVTSIAMALKYLGIKQHYSGKQFEDELQEWMEAHGLDRHAPNDLAKVVEAYGGKDKFRAKTTIDEVKDWLARGNPAVTHGYFTDSGHVICLIGYNQKGFIVHDPYGEWFPNGYERNDRKNDQKGNALTYSYKMIERTCMTGGEFWVHFISK